MVSKLNHELSVTGHSDALNVIGVQVGMEFDILVLDDSINRSAGKIEVTEPNIFIFCRNKVNLVFIVCLFDPTDEREGS